MGMDFDLFQKRIRTSSYISLKKLQEDKINSFKTALQKAYNRELVVNLRTKEEFMSLINKIDTTPSIDKKSFSTLDEHDCRLGDVLYWERRNSHWLITEMEETEKGIFQAFIEYAKVDLKWIDKETGKIYQTWACAKGPEETTIVNGVKNTIFYDTLNTSLYLKLSASADGIKLLKRYKMIMCFDKKWRVEVQDEITKDGIITLQLLEQVIDDSKDDVENNIADRFSTTFSFECPLNEQNEFRVGDKYYLTYYLFQNDKEVKDFVSQVITENCEYNSQTHILTFPTIGSAKVTIFYPELGKQFDHEINIKSDSSGAGLWIAGLNKITAFSTNEYVFCDPGYRFGHEWIYDKDYFKFVSEGEESIKLKARNKIGKTQIIYHVTDVEGIDIEFDVEVVPV